MQRAAEKTFNFVKIFMSKKLVDKMIFHETLESLHKEIPKESLTSELGGTLGDFETQSSSFLNVVKSSIEKSWDATYFN